MNLKSKLILVAVAATALLGSAAGAFAHGNRAVIDHSTPLFANPGYHQIGYVSHGTWVDVGSCYDGYCWISKFGKDGWVKAWAIDWYYDSYDWGYDHGHDHHHDHGHGPVILVP